jgi:ribosomal-protein-alanine N-acetyltransferase
MARLRQVVVSPVMAGDLPALVDLARASRDLHRPWVYLPTSVSGWRGYLKRLQEGTVVGYLVRYRETRALVGVVNVSEIVRGVFQSAYLSFYVHAAHAGQGLMSEGLAIVLAKVFGIHKLHRLEANIQPGNESSLRLVKRHGFRREGFSPRYLKIGGRWCDHERWALTREVWQARKREWRRRRTGG